MIAGTVPRQNRIVHRAVVHHDRFKGPAPEHYIRRFGYDFENSVIKAVRDVERARLINLHTMWLIERRISLPSSCNTNDSIFLRQIFADDVIICIRDDHIVLGIDTEAFGPIEGCVGRFTIIISFFSRAGHRPNRAIPLDLA